MIGFYDHANYNQNAMLYFELVIVTPNIITMEIIDFGSIGLKNSH